MDELNISILFSEFNIEDLFYLRVNKSICESCPARSKAPGSEWAIEDSILLKELTPKLKLDIIILKFQMTYQVSDNENAYKNLIGVEIKLVLG
jgi:hypothetical protein